MKKILVIFALLPLCGCAFLHSVTEDPTQRPDGTVAIKKTSVRVYTLFDAQSNLTKFRNTTGATGSNGFVFPAGTSIGQFNESTTSTNVNELIGTIVGAAVKAAIKP